MLKIVVADDEAFVLQSICTSINWKEIGLKLVGSCKDGMEAWHAILREIDLSGKVRSDIVKCTGSISLYSTAVRKCS